MGSGYGVLVPTGVETELDADDDSEDVVGLTRVLLGDSLLVDGRGIPVSTEDDSEVVAGLSSVLLDDSLVGDGGEIVMSTEDGEYDG